LPKSHTSIPHFHSPYPPSSTPKPPISTPLLTTSHQSPNPQTSNIIFSTSDLRHETPTAESRGEAVGKNLFSYCIAGFQICEQWVVGKYQEEGRKEKRKKMKD